MTSISIHSTPRDWLARPRPLAFALATILLAGGMTSSKAQPAAETAWPRLRSDATWPLFGSLSRTRVNPPATPAATHAVSNCRDDGPGSLRAAVAAAGEADTIDLSRLSCGRITLATGAIPIMLDNLEIVGPGPARLAIDGAGSDRIFIHYGHGTLRLRDVTISRGYYRSTGHDVSFGGCIAANSYVSLDHVVVRDCHSVGVGAYGGAIFAYGLIMTNSTLSGNSVAGILDDATTAGFGGAAYVYTMQLSDSTVTANRATYQIDSRFHSYGIGGGIITILGGSVTNSTIDSNYCQGRGGGIGTFSNLGVYNSTISGNTAASEMGGGLFLRQPAALQLSNSTVAANHSAGSGAGIWLNAPGTVFQSSIVADNLPATANDVGNLLNGPGPPLTLAIDGANNLIGSVGSPLMEPPDTLQLNPQLQPLADNGGNTRTHALRTDSPAIDAGNNAAALTFDQRGGEFPRVYGKAPDIGAFEQQGTPPPLAQVPVPTLSTWASALLAALISILALRRRPPRRWSARRQF